MLKVFLVIRIFDGSGVAFDNIWHSEIEEFEVTSGPGAVFFLSVV